MLTIRDYVIAVLWVYFGSLAFFILLALWLPKNWQRKKVWCAIVISVYLIPVYHTINSGMRRDKEIAQKMAQYEADKAFFDELCASAGEKIYKTIENVEGVLLLNTPKSREDDDHYHSLAFSAFSRDGGSTETYIRLFLGTEVQLNPPERGEVNWLKDSQVYLEKYKNNLMLHGYFYVDVQERNEIVRYRYELSGRDKLEQERSPATPARYAVDFVNDVNPEYREQRIAGTTVTIIDTWNQEILAKKTWYSFNALHCPPDGGYNAPTRKFVDQILKPKQEY